ncbi:hypothetical protein ACT4UT_03475, partial [Bacillus sp. B-TM1]
MPLHYPHHSVIHSTGVLTREPATVSAVINIVNLDAYYAHYVNIEVWDWSNYSNPVKLPVLIGEDTVVEFPYLLQSNNLAVFYANLDEAINLYE